VLLLTYAILTWVVGAYLIYRGVMFSMSHAFDPSSSRFAMSIVTVAIGVLSVINRAFLFIWTIRVLLNFDKGLKERVFLRKLEVNDNNFIERVPFLNN